MAVHGLAARSFELAPTLPLAEFRADVLRGLRGSPKTLPCKYLYDDVGSKLFDQICDLPEYYPTRTELGILQKHAAEMARELGNGCLLIEYGSGSSLKTPLILERMRQPAAYVPVDISREHLLDSSSAIVRQFPAIEVIPIWGDFTSEFVIPNPRQQPRRRAVYFPGSTIGNFGPSEAVRLLEGIAQLVGPRGGLLIGVDLWKSSAILGPAYDDAAGVTAAFNKNLLARINRELGADFDLDQFAHRAFVNDRFHRVEMHLVNKRSQRASINGQSISFAPGESICTEHSHKYTLEAFRDLAHTAGLVVKRVWLDDRQLFSVQYLEVT